MHLVGLTAAGVGGVVMLGVALGVGRLGALAALAVYAVCIVTMFLCSALYNMASPGRQAWLRRLDHAAIFLMIAGSYTPFTTQRLSGAWSWGMTSAIWALAVLGAGGKLFLPGLGRGFWVALYLALGWSALVALKPFLASVSLLALVLLAAGGVIYSLGLIFYLRRGLPFRRAIWHGFVVAAAATQYAAIFAGVVLSPQ